MTNRVTTTKTTMRVHWAGHESVYFEPMWPFIFVPVFVKDIYNVIVIDATLPKLIIALSLKSLIPMFTISDHTRLTIHIIPHGPLDKDSRRFENPNT